jgi:protein-disulfide isomerase
MSTLGVPVTPRDHILGPANVPVTLVKYRESPHCGVAHPIVKRVLEHFGKNIRFVFRHFPLSQVLPNAEAAAESAEFAGAHSRFRDMQDGIYENQEAGATTARTLSLILPRRSKPTFASRCRFEEWHVIV